MCKEKVLNWALRKINRFLFIHVTMIFHKNITAKGGKNFSINFSPLQCCQQFMMPGWTMIWNAFVHRLFCPWTNEQLRTLISSSELREKPSVCVCLFMHVSCVCVCLHIYFSVSVLRINNKKRKEKSHHKKSCCVRFEFSRKISDRKKLLFLLLHRAERADLQQSVESLESFFW